jgi:hypothetical protein
MSLKNRAVWMAGIAGLISGVGQVDASSLAVINAAPNTDYALGDNYGGTIGFQFTVPSDAPIYSVTGVGVYDNQNLSTASTDYGPPVDSTIDGTDDGLVTSHKVFIYDITAAGTNVPAALVTATIAAGTTGSASTANFAFTSLSTPLSLIPGDTYQIAEDVVGSDGDFWIDGGTPTFSSDFTNFGYGYGNSDSYLAYSGGGPYFGPNFQYTTVPEPVSIGFLSGALIMQLSRRRRRFVV